MTRRALPLLCDALPLYASEREIVAVMASHPASQASARAILTQPDAPRPSVYVNGGLYYVPAVLEFIDKMEAQRARPATGGMKTWGETAKRKA